MEVTVSHPTLIFILNSQSSEFSERGRSGPKFCAVPLTDAKVSMCVKGNTIEGRGQMALANMVQMRNALLRNCCSKMQTAHLKDMAQIGVILFPLISHSSLYFEHTAK